MSDLIRIRISSEDATDSSVMQIKLVVVVLTMYWRHQKVTRSTKMPIFNRRHSFESLSNE